MSDEWSAIAKVVEEKKKKSGHAWSATATVCGYTLWGKKTTEETKKQKKMKKQQEEARSKAPFVCGYTVSLLASNGHFLCGNNGNSPVTANGRGAKQDSALFTVENVGNGKVALKSCGKYLAVTEDGSTVACNLESRTRNKWSHFDWVEHASRNVSLRGANGKYVSSANGRSVVTCDRDEAGPQERFTISACFKDTHP